MKKIVFLLAVLLFCAVAQADEPSDWFIFTQKGLEVSLISRDVSMAGMPHSFNSPTAVDQAGNFYYCTTEGNPEGVLWIINRVDKSTGTKSEVCRLNLDKYKSGAIRSIEFTPSNTLYVWLTMKQAATKWATALVAIAGF